MKFRPEDDQPLVEKKENKYMKLKKGDKVKIVAGKDKGKESVIDVVVTKENKVVVNGMNQYKRHIKAKANGEKSEIKIITKPLPVAAVMFLCPKCKQTVRLGARFEGEKKVRICKKCEEAV